MAQLPKNMHVMMSYQEIADELGISKGRVRQIDQAALRKLKKRLSRLAPSSAERQFVTGAKQTN